MDRARSLRIPRTWFGICRRTSYRFKTIDHSVDWWALTRRWIIIRRASHSWNPISWSYRRNHVKSTCCTNAGDWFSAGATWRRSWTYGGTWAMSSWSPSSFQSTVPKWSTFVWSSSNLNSANRGVAISSWKSHRFLISATSELQNGRRPSFPGI